MYGKIIKELRIEKNLTQKALAQALNTSQKTISKYEKEQLDLGTETVIAVCRFFDVSADYLLGLKD